MHVPPRLRCELVILRAWHHQSISLVDWRFITALSASTAAVLCAHYLCGHPVDHTRRRFLRQTWDLAEAGVTSGDICAKCMANYCTRFKPKNPLKMCEREALCCFCEKARWHVQLSITSPFENVHRSSRLPPGSLHTSLSQCRREAQIHFAIKHENIVRVLAFYGGSPQSSFLRVLKCPLSISDSFEIIKDVCQVWYTMNALLLLPRNMYCRFSAIDQVV